MEPSAEIINIGNASLHCIDKLCYLGDMVGGARGGAEADSVAKVRNVFKELRS